MVELTLPEKVKRLRGTEPQVEAAKRIGIAQPTLSCIELGIRSGTNHRTLVKIAQAYQVPVEYLEGDLRTYMRIWAEQVLARQPATTPGQRLQLLLAELDLRYGITPDRLGETLQVSPATLQVYLEDRAAPRMLFERLEELTGISVDLLLFGPSLPADLVVSYSPAIAAAIRKGITPERLTRLIELTDPDKE